MVNRRKGCWFSYGRYNMKVNITHPHRNKLKGSLGFVLFRLRVFLCGGESCFFAFNMQTCLIPVGFATLQVKINSKDWSQTQFKSQLHLVLTVLY